MNDTTYGQQPAKQLLYADGYSIRGVADRLGINYNHIVMALYGKVRPAHELRIGLVNLLGRPVTELFTMEALEQPYQIRSNSRVQSRSI